MQRFEYTVLVFKPFGAGNGWFEDDARVGNPDEIKRILNDPSGFYVNIHDTVRPAGAIRGQLSR